MQCRTRRTLWQASVLLTSMSRRTLWQVAIQLSVLLTLIAGCCSALGTDCSQLQATKQGALHTPDSDQILFHPPWDAWRTSSEKRDHYCLVFCWRSRMKQFWRQGWNKVVNMRIMLSKPALNHGSTRSAQMYAIVNNQQISHTRTKMQGVEHTKIWGS